MRITGYAWTAILMFLLIFAGTAAFSQTVVYTQSELDELCGPIALYPDPIIAQILPASTYYDQVYTASGMLPLSDARIDDMGWDVSVQSVAHYPPIVRMMVQQPDWTIALGQAYVYYPTGCMNAIQRLRNRAWRYGYLRTNNYCQVVRTGTIIRIIPVSARYIYLPVYDPAVVYTTYYQPDFLSFTFGFLIGAWLNRDTDWHRHRIYYHGWREGTWQRRSRPYVDWRNTRYVNPRYGREGISKNRAITTRDVSDYKSRLRQSAGKFDRSIQPRLPATQTRRSNMAPWTQQNRQRALQGQRGRSVYRGSGGQTLMKQPAPQPRRATVTPARPSRGPSAVRTRGQSSSRMQSDGSDKSGSPKMNRGSTRRSSQSNRSNRDDDERNKGKGRGRR